ncbi:MAG TPA: stage II sporulation protein P [Bacillota bacterium]|nr:stage II sporulation protein P [Bacillota bacterium]
MNKLVRIIFTMFFLISLMGVAHGEEERSKGYFSLVDNRGKTICLTAIQASVGDEYLNEDNRLYRVYQIRGDVARVKFVRREKLELADDRPTLMMQWIAAIESLWRKDNDNVQTPPGKRSIAVYYTHSDESYVPTDGRSSIEGKGTIFKVGSNLASEFRKIGVPVIDDKTPHDPHDAMAYDRSRRTAVQLLKRRPLALLDCHRDAVPPQEYRKVLNNQEVTKVRIVIGRQNPNMAANNAFAKQVKAVVDRKYPGMVRGIYYGKGAYNQDLAPRAILLEFGAHTNSRYAAERGAKIFAAAAASVLYNRYGKTRSAQNAPVQRGSYKALIWILGLIVGGAVLFILLNSGIGGLKRFGKNLREEFGGDPGKKNDDSDGN